MARSTRRVARMHDRLPPLRAPHGRTRRLGPPLGLFSGAPEQLVLLICVFGHAQQCPGIEAANSIAIDDGGKLSLLFLFLDEDVGERACRTHRFGVAEARVGFLASSRRPIKRCKNSSCLRSRYNDPVISCSGATFPRRAR